MPGLSQYFLKEQVEHDPHLLRIRQFVTIGITTAIIPHIIFIAFFAILSMPWLSVLHFVSVLQYLFFIFLARRGRFHTTLFLAQLELFEISLLCVYLAGWESGFYLWLLFQPVMLFTGYRWKTWVRLFLLALGIGALVFAAAVLRDLKPYYTIPKQYLALIFYFNGLAIIITNIFIVFILNRITENAEVEEQRALDRSRNLLLNILPESVADRLSEEQKLIADAIPECSILFTDLAGFTTFSAKMSAEELVGLLDALVRGFDEVVEQHGLEKIKTIGDGYMAAAGVPEYRPDHAPAAVRCGLAMLSFLEDFNRRQNTDIRLRVGINSGRVVAGVIGKHKFTYDLWGDAVNTASRMESHGIPGTVQITENTERLLDSSFAREPRGSIEIKGKGEMQTWVVTGRRTSP